MPPRELPAPAAKKAAKKVAKKAAKKAAKKVAKKAARHTPGREMRRAYEHLGRIEVLDALAGAQVEEASALVALAQQELAAGHARNGAELLRATEHLCFAILTPLQPPARLSSDLETSIHDEFEELLRRAEENAPRQGNSARAAGLESTARLGQQFVTQARESLKQRIYRRALELARAAEALTHVEHHGPARLPETRNGQGRARLKR